MHTTNEANRTAVAGQVDRRVRALVARLRKMANNGFSTCSEAADEIEQLRAALERSRRGEHICLKCGLRQDGYDAAAHAAAYPGF